MSGDAFDKDDFLRAFVRDSTEALFLINTVDFAIEWCNQAAVALFEMENEAEFKGQFGHHFHVDLFTDEDIAAVQNALDENKVFRSHYRYRTKKGHMFWGLFETRKVRVSGDWYQAVKVIDVSENLEDDWSISIEEGLRNRSFSHLIKNSLAELLSYLYLQISDQHDLSSESQHALTDMYRRIKTLAVLLEQLAYAERSSSVDLANYLRRLVEHMLDMHDYHEIAIDIQVASVSVLPDDSLRIGMILNELMANSIKHAFTQKADNEIHVRLSQSAVGQFTPGVWRQWICDRGCQCH